MKWIIVLLGLLIILMAGLLAIRPRELSGFILEHAGKRWFQGIAVSTRILLGIVLILYADSSRYPQALFVLGWIAVAAGVALALMPPRWFRALVHRGFERFGRHVRLVALAAVLFGLFLVHAVT